VYDDVQIDSERLTLPHPHIADRDFVRLPLEECQAFIRQMNQEQEQEE
jgi:7,8-dihydro-6-hydroxymethylpterin-pyrophosphokinase